MTKDDLRWWFDRYDPDVDDAPPGDDETCDGRDDEDETEPTYG